MLLEEFQKTQIVKTKRGYIHKLEPRSEARTHTRQVCQLNLVQKRKAALYLIELCKTEKNLKTNYFHMVDTGMLTDNKGKIMTIGSFRALSMNKIYNSKKTKRELDGERLLEIIRKEGGKLDTSYSAIWYMLATKQKEKKVQMRAAAAYAGAILQELKNQGEIEIEKINCTRSIIRLKEK